MNNKMFCFQCEQTANGTGCLGEMGVCGKKAETAKLQDELTEKLITLAITLSHDNSKITETTKSLIIEGLFTTVTNVSFENKRIRKLIEEVHKEIKRCSDGCSLCKNLFSNQKECNSLRQSNSAYFLSQF